MSTIRWTESHTTDSTELSARWHSENAAPPPRRIVIADDRMRAGTACRLAREGTGLLWRGDFHNARQLLRAMGRRIDAKPVPAGTDPAQAFRLHRRTRARRAQVMGMLLVELASDHSLALRRAPDVRRACAEAYGPSRESMVVSVSELLGVIGAHQWRLKGVRIPALGGARIHPHYGVFSPVRGEYVDLVAQAPPPPATGASRVAFDIGTGTGVFAAVLARRGFHRIVATDDSPRALECARDNVRRLNLGDGVEIEGPCLFPAEGRADLIVCNPPWLPGRPATAIEHGVYDPGSAMLSGFLDGLAAHLTPGGQGWLILSDLAEHLELRTRGELLAAIAAAGLHVTGRLDTRPRHPRASDPTDPFHTARAAEVTSLWCLEARS
ncbi:methyltransferase [Spongiactinospora gelatinilytica]|uniref:Methyltransferase n=1 Tax=Spongiactinospora gelatinilytica TaxID=2666298 RepID=A0A2W2ELY7_9ACTN|nr:class I SAM-dependent methyltransferase [Spongiactinospora gelatinilytica]PZG25332.1 methyltransferase [Spongiactinospora gelatinilytica]